MQVIVLVGKIEQIFTSYSNSSAVELPLNGTYPFPDFRRCVPLICFKGHAHAPNIIIKPLYLCQTNPIKLKLFIEAPWHSMSFSVGSPSAQVQIRHQKWQEVHWNAWIFAVDRPARAIHWVKGCSVEPIRSPTALGLMCFEFSETCLSHANAKPNPMKSNALHIWLIPENWVQLSWQTKYTTAAAVAVEFKELY